MDKKNFLIVNLGVSVLLQIVTFISGFILPKFYLIYYGSVVNGLVSSITQYLGFITFAECGIGAVIQSTLYRPLANKDQIEISKIMISAEKFFKKLGYILIWYVIILMIIYPSMINDKFSWLYTVSLIFVISISTFAQYYFSMAYKLLLSADQLGYIQMGLQIIVIILNTFFSVFLIKKGYSIQSVKLFAAIIFLIQPIGLHFYIKKYYNLDMKLELKEEPIKQKWNGLSQHIAAVVLSRVDIIVLTFYSLADVSVYNVYFLAVYGVRFAIEIVINAFQPFLGNIYVKQEELLKQIFLFWERGVHALVTLLFNCTGILILPFVMVYTKGITDINYIVPNFSILITVAYAFFCLRLPYTTMIKIAGHYKETQWSCLIETGINIIFSVLLVFKWGLCGVAVATVVSMIYRTLYCVFYLRKNILFRPIKFYIKNLIVDIIATGICIFLTYNIKLQTLTWRSWLITAIEVGIICLASVLFVNYICYRKMIHELFNYIKKRRRCSSDQKKF